MSSKRIYKPKQERSRKSMNQMLEAAEALLEEKTWQELTVQDVVSQAGTSIGAFYGRFRDKEGLLHALDERYFEAIIDRIETAVSDPIWQTLSLAETVQRLAELVVAMLGQGQGVMRTLILQARLTPDTRFREREARLMESLPPLMALVLAHRKQIAHDDVETAVHFGFIQLFFTAREMVIWPHVAAAMPYQNMALVNALAHAYLGYLGAA